MCYTISINKLQKTIVMEANLLEFLFMAILIPICKIMEFFEKKTEVTTSNGKKLKYIPTKCAKLFEECLQRNNDRVFYVVNSFTNKEVLVQNVDIYMPEPDGTLKESAILLEDYLMPVFEAEDHFVQMNIFKKKGKVRIVGMDLLFLERALQKVYGKPVKMVRLDKEIV